MNCLVGKTNDRRINLRNNYFDTDLNRRMVWFVVICVNISSLNNNNSYSM